MLEIWTEALPKGWEWSPSSYLGGTPEFIVNTAECSRFEEVIVYYDGPSCEHNGIYYLSRDKFRGEDVVLACNHKPPSLGRYNIYWSNLNDIKDEDYLEFDERIVLSQYHKSRFGDKSRIVPHSLYPEQFKNPKKVKKQCLYSSSPDRGGKFLFDIWSEVHERTGANLIMTYDKQVSEEQMIEYYKSSEFWLHPCQGIEMFCIAAAKAQVAKCIPVVVPNMALETTVKYGIKTTLENYKEDLIKAIENPPKIKDVDFGTWQTVTDELFKHAR